MLERQPEDLKEFLLGTSILDRLTAPLCDAVLGTDDAAGSLDALARSNAFVVALDDHREWYRYHHLFSELLRAELKRRHPELLPVYLRRAAGWCETHGTPDEAFAYAHEAVGEGHRWEDAYLPFDDKCWCAWWVRNGGPWRLTFSQGGVSLMWATTYDCLDVHTGEVFDVDRTWTARRARLEEYPAYLRERWWTTDKGTLIGCWSTMSKSGAGYLIERRQVEMWVREAVQAGVATAGQQLTLDVA